MPCQFPTLLAHTRLRHCNKPVLLRFLGVFACACREDTNSSVKIQDILAWLPAIQLQASGRLEAALPLYKDILRAAEAGESSIPDDGLAFIVAQASQAYTALADWQGLEAFFEYLEVPF